MSNKFFKGIIGSILGAIIFSIPWILIYVYANYILSILSAIIAYGSLLFYKKFGGEIKQKEKEYIEIKQQREEAKQDDTEEIKSVVQDFLSLNRPTSEIMKVIINRIEIHQDKQVDLYNNNIGIGYGQRYPNISRQQLLDILFNDYYNNRNNRLKQLGY